MLFISSRWPNILSTAEAEDGVENEAEEHQSHSESSPFSEALGEVDCEHDSDHKVYQGNDQQHDPPKRTSDDFEKHDDIIDWDDCRPTRLSGFREYFPNRSDEENGDS